MHIASGNTSNYFVINSLKLFIFDIFPYKIYAFLRTRLRACILLLAVLVTWFPSHPLHMSLSHAVNL